MKIELTIQVPVQFLAYIDSTIVRVGYIHPKLKLKRVQQTIIIDGDSEHEVDVIKRDILHTMYREKIYGETLEMRVKLIENIMK